MTQTSPASSSTVRTSSPLYSTAPHHTATITLAQSNVDALGGVNIDNQRTVTIAPDTSLNWTALLDMGNVVGAIVVGNGSNIRFENTVVKVQHCWRSTSLHSRTQGVASRYLSAVLTWRDNFNTNSGAWPSLIVRPGGTVGTRHKLTAKHHTHVLQVSYINATLYSLRDDCSLAGRQRILDLLNAAYNNMTVLKPNGAIETLGTHVRDFPVVNLTGIPVSSPSESGTQGRNDLCVNVVCQCLFSTPTPVGNFTLEVSNTLGICVVDPLRPYDTLNSSVAAPAPASDSPPSWLWVAIFVPVGVLIVALLACFATYCFIARRRGKQGGGSKVLYPVLHCVQPRACVECSIMC